MQSLAASVDAIAQLQLALSSSDILSVIAAISTVEASKAKFPDLLIDHPKVAALRTKAYAFLG